MLDLLKEIEKLDCNPVSTSIDSKYKLDIENDEPIENINHFQRLIDRLIYLTVTRSDIFFHKSN
jgi:hypothetical protein